VNRCDPKGWDFTAISSFCKETDAEDEEDELSDVVREGLARRVRFDERLMNSFGMIKNKRL